MNPKAILTLGWIFITLCSALSSPIRITPADFTGAKQPQITVTDQGKVFVTFGRTNNIYVVTSADGGENFTSPQKIGTLDKLALGMRRGPRIASTQSSVIVTGISHADGNLYAWRSSEDGKDWSQPMIINSVTNSAREGMHALASDGKGRLFSAWLDLRNGKTELWGASSDNGGKTWKTNQMIYRSPAQTICECCHPSAIFTPKGELIVMWRNWLNGQRDMYRTVSTDGGKTFAPATKLGIGSWPLQGCPMDGGHLAASTNETVYVWRRNQTLFLSSDSQPETELATKGTQPIAVSANDGFRFIWQDQGNLYTSISTNGSPQLLAPNASYAATVYDSKQLRVLTVWESADGIYFLRLP